MKKNNRKALLKFIAFTLAIINSFGFFAKAEKAPFPKGCFRVFNVAVIGGDVVDGRTIEESTGFNKFIIDNLCNAGTKLENFERVEDLDDNKISVGDQTMPRTSVMYNGAIISFYDVANLYDPEIIKECPYAICPYQPDMTENPDDLEARMSRVVKFVKTKNEMCDLNFIVVKDEKLTNDENSKYLSQVGRIAKYLDIYEYQQSVDIFRVPADIRVSKTCQSILENLLAWNRTREEDFRKCMGKSFPIIYGYKLSLPKPTASTIPRHKPVDPMPNPQTAPESSTPECAKKKCGQIDGCGDSDRVARDIYDDYLFPRHDEAPPAAYVVFEKILKILLENNFNHCEIIEGLKKIEFNRSCFRTEIQYIECKGYKYRSVLEAYNDIFKNEFIRKLFVEAFKTCLDSGCTHEQIVQALFSLKISQLKFGFSCNYHVIKSDEIVSSIRPQGKKVNFLSQIWQHLSGTGGENQGT